MWSDMVAFIIALHFENDPKIIDAPEEIEIMIATPSEFPGIKTLSHQFWSKYKTEINSTCEGLNRDTFTCESGKYRWKAYELHALLAKWYL